MWRYEKNNLNDSYNVIIKQIYLTDARDTDFFPCLDTAMLGSQFKRVRVVHVTWHVTYFVHTEEACESDTITTNWSSTTRGRTVLRQLVVTFEVTMYRVVVPRYNQNSYRNSDPPTPTPWKVSNVGVARDCTNSDGRLQNTRLKFRDLCLRLPNSDLPDLTEPPVLKLSHPFSRLAHLHNDRILYSLPGLFDAFVAGVKFIWFQGFQSMYFTRVFLTKMFHLGGWVSVWMLFNAAVNTMPSTLRRPVNNRFWNKLVVDSTSNAPCRRRWTRVS